MTRNRIITALKMGTAFAAFAGASPLLAQTADGGGQPAGTEASEEQQAAAANDAREDVGTAQDQDIIVTARRRAESLQDVPIAVTAYSGEALERCGWSFGP